MEYLEKMKAIQNSILEYFDDDGEKISDELSSLLNDHKDIHDLKSILYLISKINQNHHRGLTFNDKIKAIINILKPDIKQNLSNVEIVDIFEADKRILLLLIDENILDVDDAISERLSIHGDYFYPEIRKFNQTASNDEPNKELPDDFEEKRRIGENDLYVCQLIRNDNVEDFIINYNKNLFSLNDKINHSIFETNPFLINNETSLLNYTLFFGSIQILQFLRQNGIEFKPSSWLYSIHGKNPEIIHLLEGEKILPEDPTYKQCFLESIKCHHNDFAIYIKDNLLNEKVNQENQNNLSRLIGQNIRLFKKQNSDNKKEDKLCYLDDEIFYGFQFYNFSFIPEDLSKPIYFFYSADFGYYKLVDFMKNQTGLDINQSIILFINYFNLILQKN